MLEVLIALLVLSVGLLGLAGLQYSGLKSNRSAYLRSQASILASQITDSMRTNRANAASYVVSFGSTPTGTTLADQDLQEWKTNLANSLPSGDGKIAVTGNLVTVTIQWDDSGAITYLGTTSATSAAVASAKTTQLTVQMQL